MRWAWTRSPAHLSAVPLAPSAIRSPRSAAKLTAPFGRLSNLNRRRGANASAAVFLFRGRR
jgi:hypothetical protein